MTLDMTPMLRFSSIKYIHHISVSKCVLFIHTSFFLCCDFPQGSRETVLMFR